MIEIKLSQNKHRPMNQKGFSITEVLIAAGLLAIISLGVATLLQNMAIEQKRIVLFNTLRELKSRIEFVVRDPTSWSNTVNNSDGINGTTLDCLKNSTVCTVQVPASGTPTKIVLKDATNANAFNLLDWAGTGTNGFTEAGVPCTTFSATAGAGRDTCPISYRLVQVMFCSGGAATCRNPQIKITARLIYNPGTQGVLERFRTLVAVGNLTPAPGTSGADSDTDDARYDVAIKRTSSQLNRSFKFSMNANDTEATPTNPQQCKSGVGSNRTCNSVAITNHPRVWNTTVGQFENSFGLADVSGGSGQIKFTETGYYSCTISVTAFATMGFYADLYNATTSTIVSTATTVAGEWATAAAVIDTKFNVTNIAHQYYIRQRCDSLPSARHAGLNVDNCTLGMNTSSYSASPGNEIVTMSCYKIDKTF